jgi:hypothetical protein
MADFVLSSASICTPYRAPWGAFPKTTRFVSTGVSSAAIPVGRQVSLDFTEGDASTNQAYVKGSTSAAGAGNFYVVGIAASAASGSTATAGVTALDIWDCNPNVEFKAVTKGGTLQSSHVGRGKAFSYDSTLQIAYVDLGASTVADHRVVVTGLIDAVGDSGGYVSFRYLTQSLTQGSTVVSSTPFLAFYR